MINIFERPITGRNLVLKMIEDRVGSFILLVGLSLLLLLIALMIRLTSPGPALFQQKRYGFNNEEFTVYKFRTMRAETAQTSEGHDSKVDQATRGDPRVTWVGNILRKTSLDELPQLINVLTGCSLCSIHFARRGRKKGPEAAGHRIEIEHLAAARFDQEDVVVQGGLRHCRIPHVKRLVIRGHVAPSIDSSGAAGPDVIQNQIGRRSAIAIAQDITLAIVCKSAHGRDQRCRPGRRGGLLDQSSRDIAGSRDLQTRVKRERRIMPRKNYHAQRTFHAEPERLVIRQM